MQIAKIHHVAIICSDCQKSKNFYTKILGCKIVAETYRQDKNSYKLDLQLANGDALKLFSVPTPPTRVNNPEACGLRYLACAVADVDAAVTYL